MSSKNTIATPISRKKNKSKNLPVKVGGGEGEATKAETEQHCQRLAGGGGDEAGGWQGSHRRLGMRENEG